MLGPEIILERYGYTVIKSTLSNHYLNYKEDCRRWFEKQLKLISKKQKVIVSDLGYFHELLVENNIDVHEFISKLPNKRFLPDELVFNQYIEKLVKECSHILKTNYKLHSDVVFFRICRPGYDDSNELHRDTWFTNYEELLNIYVPLCGSYNDSALPIVPFSHKWDDEDVRPNIKPGGTNKFIKNNIAYSAPKIGYSKYEIKPHRPDIHEGDYMIFDSRIVHGGGDNNSPETRLSLELRIEKVD